MINYSVIVSVPLEMVWNQLLIKIEKPENFVPGVSNVILLDKKEALVLRQMTITTEGNSFEIKEKITFSPYCIRFLIIEHPLFEGYVDNIAKTISDNETEIMFIMNWKDKKNHQPMNNQELLKSAVLKTKEYIEKSL